MELIKESAVFRQWKIVKEKHPDVVVLFRVKDCYETISDDAAIISKVLGVTLCKKNGSVQLAGFPASALDNYLVKLTKSGYRVALVDPE